MVLALTLPLAAPARRLPGQSRRSPPRRTPSRWPAGLPRWNSGSTGSICASISASGNAARAEALLVAFAVRRVVERGAPLDYLADQLKLRFGDAQPRAVATIIGEARDMLPLDQLAAQLETMAPQLTATGQQSLWTRVTRELSEMLVIRRDAPVLSDADARLNDARMALSQGHIDQAIADVGHLSSGNDAARWTMAARRYRDVEAALDLIDTTALLEPRQLHDAAGNPANQSLN